MLYPAGHTYTVSSYNNDNCQITKATAKLAASDTKIAASATRVNLIVPRGASFQGAIKTSDGSSSTPTPGAGNGGSGNGSDNGDGSSHPTDSPSGSGGLSTGAKIVIGVAVPLAAILGAMVIAFFLLRRRQKKRTKQSQNFANSSPEDEFGKPELEGNGQGAIGVQGVVIEKQELNAAPSSPHMTNMASELRGSEAIRNLSPSELNAETAQPRELEDTYQAAQELDPASAPAVELSGNTMNVASTVPAKEQHRIPNAGTVHGANEPWNWDYMHYVGNDNQAVPHVVETPNLERQKAQTATDNATISVAQADVTKDTREIMTTPATESSKPTDEDRELAHLREQQALLEAQLKRNRELIQQAEFSGSP